MQINSVFRASFWSIGTEFAIKVITPVSFLVLTKYLSPSDFGIIAVATMIIGFTYVIADIGVSRIIIQLDESNPEFDKLLNLGFLLNITIGFILSILCFTFSKSIAEIFRIPESVKVIQILSPQVLLTSLVSIHHALFRKQLNFKKIFFIRITTSLIPAIVSIILVIYGFGFISIAYAQLIGSISVLLLTLYLSNWKPNFQIELRLFKHIYRKSVWSSLEQIFMWLPIVTDTYIISTYLGANDLGLYSTSRNLFTSAIALTLGALLPVLFSSYSKLNNNKKQLLDFVYKSQYIIFFLATLMGVFVFVNFKYFEFLIFGNEWSGVTPIISTVFLMLSITYFFMPMNEAVQSLGGFKTSSSNTIINFLITIPFLFYSASHGLVFYVIVRFAFLYLKLPVIYYYLKKNLNISYSILLKQNMNLLVFLLVNVCFKYCPLILINVAFLDVFILIFSTFILFYFEKNRILEIVTFVKKKSL